MDIWGGREAHDTRIRVRREVDERYMRGGWKRCSTRATRAKGATRATGATRNTRTTGATPGLPGPQGPPRQHGSSGPLGLPGLHGQPTWHQGYQGLQGHGSHRGPWAAKATSVTGYEKPFHNGFKQTAIYQTILDAWPPHPPAPFKNRIKLSSFRCTSITGIGNGKSVNLWNKVKFTLNI